MQLKTVGGNLTLSSVYELFLTGFIFSIGALCSLIAIAIVYIGIAAGGVQVDGKFVPGMTSVFQTAGAMLVLIPLAVIVQAAMWSALMTGGIWLYRLRHPLRIIDASTAA